MANFSFEDFTIEVLAKMGDVIEPALEECAGEIVSRTKRNSRVDTGYTKNSFQYKVSSTDTGYRADIGSNAENAIYEEFGTGEYALNGNGRKGGWYYVDAKGKGHFTMGKKPSRAFYKAYIASKNMVIARLQNAVKGL